MVYLDCEPSLFFPFSSIVYAAVLDRLKVTGGEVLLISMHL